MTNDLLKLKASLCDAIDKWLEIVSNEDGWDDLETYIGDNTKELMADTAFNILLAQKDLTVYLKREKIITP